MSYATINIKSKVYKTTYWLIKIMCFLRINPKKTFVMNMPLAKIDLGKKVTIWKVKDLIK